MFCSKCGAENTGNNRFCEKCGAPLESNGEGEYLLGSDYLHYGFGHILLIIAIIATIVAVVLNSKKAN